MKITRTKERADYLKEQRKIANEGCNVCPCCGATTGYFSDFHNDVRYIYKEAFGPRFKIDCYECDVCGAQWESEPYEYECDINEWRGDISSEKLMELARRKGPIYRYEIFPSTNSCYINDIYCSGYYICGF